MIVRCAASLLALAAVFLGVVLPCYAQSAPASLEGVLVGFIGEAQGTAPNTYLFYMEKGRLYMAMPIDDEAKAGSMWEAPRFAGSASGNEHSRQDHRGWRWVPCTSVFYAARGDVMMLRVEYRQRHEYHISLSASSNRDSGYDDWSSSDAPAELTLKPGRGNLFEAEVKGVLLSPDMSSPPERLAKAKVLVPAAAPAAPTAPSAGAPALVTVDGCRLQMSSAGAKRHATGSAGMEEARLSKYANHARLSWQPLPAGAALDFDTFTFASGRWMGGEYSGTYTQERVGKHALFLTLRVLEENEELVDVMHLLLEFAPDARTGKLVWGWEHSMYGNVSFVVQRQGAASAPAAAPQAPRSAFERLCLQAAAADDLMHWQTMKKLASSQPGSLTAAQRELFDIAYFCARPFRDASSRHYAKRLRPLLAGILAGGGVQERSVSGNTALHYAAAMGSRKLTMWLVLHGADINARNEDGQTPLDCLGVNKSGLDAWMISRGAVRSHELRPGDAVLMEHGSTRY